MSGDSPKATQLLVRVRGGPGAQAPGSEKQPLLMLPAAHAHTSLSPHLRGHTGLASLTRSKIL